MDVVLQGLDFAFFYIDNLLIASANESERQEHLQKILERLRHLTRLSAYLEHNQYSTWGTRLIRREPSLVEKVEAIINFPKQKTIEDIRHLLGMVNFYRRFSKNAAAAQVLLTELLKGAKRKRQKTY